MKITGDEWLADGKVYIPPKSPTAAAKSSFAVLTNGGLYVTRRPSEALAYPDDTPLLVSMYDLGRVYSMAMTVGELRIKVANRGNLVASGGH
jgi:hypothetical protein